MNKNGLEIERKFVLPPNLPLELSVLSGGMEIQQGYLNLNKTTFRLSSRVEKGVAEYWQTVKSMAQGLEVKEWEIEIPKWAFDELWPHTEGLRIVKTRYKFQWNNRLWELDEFKENLSSLWIIECEFPSVEEAEAETLPGWLKGSYEASYDPFFKNRLLCTRTMKEVEMHLQRMKHVV